MSQKIHPKTSKPLALLLYSPVGVWYDEYMKGGERMTDTYGPKFHELKTRIENANFKSKGSLARSINNAHAKNQLTETEWIILREMIEQM